MSDALRRVGLSLGWRVHWLVRESPVDLFEAVLFMFSMLLLVVVALPVPSYGVFAMETLAPEWVWGTATAFLSLVLALGWFRRSVLVRRLAGLFGVVFYLFLAVVAFLAHALYIFAGTALIMAQLSAIVVWRAED